MLALGASGAVRFRHFGPHLCFQGEKYATRNMAQVDISKDARRIKQI
jgi:hypothetical protein